ncbi:tripartite motif-containing protein 10-like [Elgaria multicarinata webbii]|uniref:tripartite motif-containing protein 10-like n=1 Tax=Elgaria multicarinata webbii TaxID=159646 RepID=UPI002FCD0DF0
MAAASQSTDVEWEATCPICREYLTDPVTLDCGHNYCLGCITNYREIWEEQGGDLGCSICRAPIQNEDFRQNWQLANIVEQIKLLPLHLEIESLCLRHKEKLRLFCKEDEVLVCWKCKCSPEHNSHTVLLKEEAAQEHKELIRRRLESLRNERGRILANQADTEKENEDLLKKTRVEKEKTVAVFRQLHQFLEEQEQLLLVQMEEVEKEIARRREKHQARLSEELFSLERLIQEMEEKCQQPAGELLQDVRSTLLRSEKETFENPVAFPPELKWRIWDFREINPFLEGVMEQFKDVLLTRLPLMKANVTLDPDTAHPRLILSEDHKSVRWGDKQQDVPDNPERFEKRPFVLGREGFTAGRHFWEVSVGSEEYWAVGVARESVRRKGPIGLSPEEEMWVVEYVGGLYWASNPPHFPRLSLSEELKRIRVILNCAGGRVSFYDADRGTLLYAFSGDSFAGETLLPFFHVWGKGHLSISP